MAYVVTVRVQVDESFPMAKRAVLTDLSQNDGTTKGSELSLSELFTISDVLVRVMSRDLEFDIEVKVT